MKTITWLLAAFIYTTSIRSQNNKPVISISKLTGNFYICQSFILFGKEFVPCNSLYAVTDKGVILISTPPDEDQTRQLIDSIARRHHKKIALAIAPHFHADGTGGFGVLQQQGIPTWSSLQTLQLCRERKEHPAQFYFVQDTSLTIGGETLQTYYPGEGHARDNIVVWFAREKILFGGCFVKSVDANDLGFLGDANTAQWPVSVENVRKRFPSPRYIIPGHQRWTDTASLSHTLDLLRKYRQQKAGASPAEKEGLLFSDDFETALDTSVWVSEIAQQPNSRVYTSNGKLVLDTKGGVTVWLKKKLQGNFRIEYDRIVVAPPAAGTTGESAAGSGNERVSDLNQFWMATDPRNNNLFTRNGVLEAYDSLLLYYVGMGGNSNKTTRFRKYEGTGERKLLQEYTDRPHLLEGGKTYHITTIVKDGTTQFYVNGELYFSFTDPSPLKEGYFGFRSTKSRQLIEGIKIYRIK